MKCETCQMKGCVLCSFAGLWCDGCGHRAETEIEYRAAKKTEQWFCRECWLMKADLEEVSNEVY